MAMTATDPPPDPRPGRGRTRTKPQRPALGQYDALIHMLLSTPDSWHVVDAYDSSRFAPTYSPPVMVMLHRRGFDVVRRQVNGETLVWARWPFPVPEWVVVSEIDPDRQLPTGAPWEQLGLEFEQ